MARVLLLGGTQEAQELAASLHAAGVPFLVSLAGRAPAQYAGPVRTGGFGGAEGLAAAIREGRFTTVVDATHPFAATISPAAVRAAHAAGVSYHRLERPPWRPCAGDTWTFVASLGEAAARLSPGARVFLAVGAGGLAPFLYRRDVSFLVRAIAGPDTGGRDDVVVVRARGPFDVSGERALWDAHRFTALVTKNAGGAASAAKLAVARERRTPVLMVRRPAGQPPADACSADAMMALLRTHLFPSGTV